MGQGLLKILHPIQKDKFWFKNRLFFYRKFSLNGSVECGLVLSFPVVLRDLSFTVGTVWDVCARRQCGHFMVLYIYRVHFQ